MNKLSLYLPTYDVTLDVDIDIDIPSCKSISVYGGESFSEFSLSPLFNLIIDERGYNPIRSSGLLREIRVALRLIDKFNDFKKSDVSYGDYKSDGTGYQGTKELCVKDFFNFLIVENRELLISNILS